MKVIIEYDPSTQIAKTATGGDMFVGDLKYTEYKESDSGGNSDILTMLKLGVSAEDIINLKHQDLIK